MSEFNPYHVWLGIAPAEMPPTHYRLLGINPFEESADVICSAADRQMAHLRTFQTGPRATACQKLLTEVSAAAACLLDEKKKLAYDAILRAPYDATLRARLPASRTRKRQPSVIGNAIQIIFGGSLGIAFAVLVLAYFFGVDLLGWQKKEVATAPPPAVRKPSSKPPAPAPAPAPAVTIKQPAFAIPSITPPPAAFPAPPTAPAPAPVPAKEVAPAKAIEEPVPPPAEPVAEEYFTQPASEPPQRPPVAAVEPPAPSVATAKAKPKEPAGDILEIYNTHNWKYGDSGAKTCNVSLRNGQKVVWQKDKIPLSWDAKENAKTVVQLPQIRYLSLRIEITDAYGRRAGLADVAVLRNGRNVALNSPVIASEIYSGNGQCSPAMAVDGSGDIGDGQGYWMLKGNAGWLEMLVAGNQPRSRR